MALVWRNIFILVFAHFVGSVINRSTGCGKPPAYPDKQLRDKYRQKSVFKNEESVFYACAPGYMQSEGSRESKCESGRWTPLNMKCQKKNCNGLGDIENGQYIREGQSFGDKAIAVCNKGYVLRGEKVRMCTEIGWNGTDPFCEVSKIICSAPAVANRQIKTGERTQYAAHDTVNIVCSEGFDLTGSPQVTCGPDGQWQALPECRPKGQIPKVLNSRDAILKACPTPNLGKNGTVNEQKSNYKPGEFITVTCNEGFIGSRVYKCRATSKWHPKEPKCQKGRIPKVVNSRATILKTCLTPNLGKNGTVKEQKSNYKPRESITVTCNEGFIGSGVFTCQATLKWHPEEPKCQMITCSAPTVANGRTSPGSWVYKYRDSVYVICNEGFDLIGSPQVACGPDGQWQALPECRPTVITCSAPTVANGRTSPGSWVYKYRDTVDVICNEGFDLIGSPQVACGPDGQWQALPECRPTVITCSAPTVANGRTSPGSRVYKYRDTVYVICNEGFDLIGSPQVACGPDGQWQALPECRPTVITCSAPTVANGRTSPGSRVYRYRDTVYVICNEGFDLIGSPQVACGPDGQWQALPECRPKRISGKCGPAPLYPQAIPRDSSSTLKEHPSGARILYKCSLGLVRTRGSSIIRCQNGQWTNLELQCERKKCGSAGEISYGQYKYTGVSLGDSATVVCQEGYELLGPKVRICRDGGWDGRSPVCEPVHCPPPPEVKDAEMSDPIYDHVPFGHVLSYKCRTGTLIGAREIYCTESGTWSAPPPECKDIVCPSPRVPGGSRMRGFRAVYKYGNTVTITCKPGLSLLGESFVTCGPDGQWNPKLPECVHI